MERMIAYLLQSMLVSGVLSAYYWIALRNRKLHRYNRGYLLGALLLSLLLPLMPVNWIPGALADVPVLAGSVERVENLGRSADNGWHWVTIGCRIGMIVSSLLLLLNLRRVVQVCRQRAGLVVSRMARGVDVADPANKKILAHELAHITGRHSWDALFASLVCCLFWMNPFFWLFRKELVMTHEFIADSAMGMEGDADGFARMILQSVYGSRLLDAGQAFSRGPINRRLLMISHVRERGPAFARKALVMPVLMAVVWVISCSKVQEPAVSEALDQAKLRKEQLDLKIKRLVLIGALKKVPSPRALPKTGTADPEDKIKWEKLLQEAEQVEGNKPITRIR